MTLAAQIDALLPQTQCTRCGFSGCRPYADALAAGAAPLNQCPPGGSATIEALADLLNQPVLPLNPVHGTEGPWLVAVIDEARCIGCARCLPPCPVDAIVGARKFLHTVIAERCTGCELCLAPCPVDCIEMRPARPEHVNLPPVNRARYEAHEARRHDQLAERQRGLDAQKAAAHRAGLP